MKTGSACPSERIAKYAGLVENEVEPGDFRLALRLDRARFGERIAETQKT
ncbi:hypothetical protein ACNHKD_16585 [Methylocystis sp. JAN1]